MWLTNPAKGRQKALRAPQVSEAQRLTRAPASRLAAV